MKRSHLIFSLVTILIVLSMVACSPEPAPNLETEPADTESELIESTEKSEPTQSEPTKSEPTQSEPTKSEPTQSEPIKSEPEALVFIDPVFERLIQESLKKTEIFAEDLAHIFKLTIGGDHFMLATQNGEPEVSIVLLQGEKVELNGEVFSGFGTMQSLADLTHFPELTALSVTLQPELDYSTIPQAVKEKLRRVFFTKSNIKDLEFLRGATSVYSISLSINEIEDISPLEDCSQLLYLNVDWNQVSDLSPLAGLTQIKTLSFYGNNISDLSPLAGLVNLQQLWLYQNQVSDLTPLSGLTNLTDLELIDNQVRDVSPLKNFEQFEWLRLSGNPIGNIELLGHIQNMEFKP